MDLQQWFILSLHQKQFSKWFWKMKWLKWFFQSNVVVCLSMCLCISGWLQIHGGVMEDLAACFLEVHIQRERISDLLLFWLQWQWLHWPRHKEKDDVDTGITVVALLLFFLINLTEKQTEQEMSLAEFERFFFFPRSASLGSILGILDMAQEPSGCSRF